MPSMTGKILQVSIFGESHGKAVGGVIDGLPAGFEINEEKLQFFLQRRSPGHGVYSSSRYEKDSYEIVSGYYKNKTTGTPLAFFISNRNIRSQDYEKIANIMRPSHADYTSYIKYKGFADSRGGGHFSGRLTAPLCFMGGVAMQILEEKGIEMYAHISRLCDIEDLPIESVSLEEQRNLASKEMAFCQDICIEKAKKKLQEVRQEKDSLGGIIEVMVHHIKAGLGNPFFESIESRLASLAFSIPGVTGVEFGTGFASAFMKGSQYNDSFCIEGDRIYTKSNHSGGLNGGITNGMPLIMRVAIKPTPSIGKVQETIDIEKKENTQIEIQGRHDPSIVVRAVPVVEAVTAIALLDIILEEGRCMEY